MTESQPPHPRPPRFACPACSRLGLVMLAAGVGMLLLPWWWTDWMGLALVLGSYFVPGLRRGNCRI